MTVKQDTAVVRAMRGSALGHAGGDGAQDWIASPLVENVANRLDSARPRFVARAPGHLDIMAGLADYTGALVLNMPTGAFVCAAVQTRSDPVLAVTMIERNGSTDATTVEISWKKLLHAGAKDSGGSLLSKSDLSEAEAMVARTIAGVVTETTRTGSMKESPSGISVVIESAFEDGLHRTPPASIASAVVTALVAAIKADVKLEAAADLCRKVEDEWLGRCGGIAETMCVLGGEVGMIAQIRCDPCSLEPAAPIPNHLGLVGIDCGVVHDDAAIKYDRARVASCMGRVLVDRIIQHEGAGRMRWDGYLSRISIADYVERFRDRLPTKIKGREFLDRFGETGDSFTTIEPDFIYKVRSRTEHHIYEHVRSQQFVERLARSSRGGKGEALLELSELMYASHWSYGQRCGLGSIETDLLVKLLRGHGAAAGVHGAKVVGRGCGGVVLALTEATDRASSAVSEVLEVYAAKTGRKPRVLSGSMAGAWVAGVHTP